MAADVLAEALLSGAPEGITISGGEPFLQSEGLALLLRTIRTHRPSLGVIVYTGYTYERDLLRGGDKHTSHTDEMLSLIDVLVDGRIAAEGGPELIDEIGRNGFSAYEGESV